LVDFSFKAPLVGLDRLLCALVEGLIKDASPIAWPSD
jgi:hypothetical protein